MVTRSTGPLLVVLGPIDAVAILIGLSSFGLVSLIRLRLPIRSPAQSLETWWTEQLGRVVLLWCLLEFPAVVGAITLLVTRHLPVYGSLAVLALGGFIALRPGRISTAG